MPHQLEIRPFEVDSADPLPVEMGIFLVDRNGGPGDRGRRGPYRELSSELKLGTRVELLVCFLGPAKPLKTDVVGVLVTLVELDLEHCRVE